MDSKPIMTLPAVGIYPVPNPTPAVVPENRDAALRCLGGALAALNLGGYEVEHHARPDGELAPYGLIWQATADILAQLYPELDAEKIMRERLNHSGDISAAVKAVRREGDR